MSQPAAEPEAIAIQLDPVSLVLHASGPVFVVFWSLVLAAVLVWIVTVLKLLQLRRLRLAEERFEAEAALATDAGSLFVSAQRHAASPGGRVVLELAKRAGSHKLLDSIAKRALVTEQQRAGSFMSMLASIASAAPFVGLFGTVYGIMDAFLRIGQQKSASLPVVAPAIGEALIATAVGLVAAIPAVIAYNALNKRIDDLLGPLEASADGWVALSEAAAEEASALRRPADAPMPQPGQYFPAY